MLISFVAARRVRPIYRSVRKDVEQIDGRVGEAFTGSGWCGLRSEILELLDYMSGGTRFAERDSRTAASCPLTSWACCRRP